MKKYIELKQWMTQRSYLAAALVMLFASVAMALPAGAYAQQLTSRSIEMSDSGPSGGTISSGVGSGTNVVYKVTFTPSTTAIGGIVVDFCTNSPLYFETCTAPTGFNANSASIQVYNQTNLGSGSFSVYTTTPVANRVILTRATPAAAAAAASFELGNGTTNGLTNPSTTGTFYARIYTYDTAAHAQAHNQAAATGGEVDFGGLALSTANVITITARVQESLIFCVTKSTPSANCGSGGTPTLTIGHTVGAGTNKVITSGQVDTDTAYTQVSTNAYYGAVVRMRNNNSCGGLSADGGSTCGIPAVGSGAATAAAMTAGTAAFGMFVATGSGDAGSNAVTPSTNYNDGSHTTVPTNLYYGMDTTSTENVTTTYGDTIESCTGPTSNFNNELVFAATAANATPAGLYTANMSLIATGMF